MTKVSKPKKAKEKKKAAPKLVAAGIGHNSGQVVPELVKIVDEILASAERQKQEGRNQRDLRNRAKSEFGILSTVLAHEIGLRKKDPDVRAQFESGHRDLKSALGYQEILTFDNPNVEPPAVKPQPKPVQAVEADPLAIPANLRRAPKPPAAQPVEEDEDEVEEDDGEDQGQPGVITRAG